MCLQAVGLGSKGHRKQAATANKSDAHHMLNLNDEDHATQQVSQIPTDLPTRASNDDKEVSGRETEVAMVWWRQPKWMMLTATTEPASPPCFKQILDPPTIASLPCDTIGSGGGGQHDSNKTHSNQSGIEDGKTNSKLTSVRKKPYMMLLRREMFILIFFFIHYWEIFHAYYWMFWNSCVVLLSCSDGSDSLQQQSQTSNDTHTHDSGQEKQDTKMCSSISNLTHSQSQQQPF